MIRLLAGLLVVVSLLALVAVLRPDPAPLRVHRYGGVEWQGDDCYVEGTSILCRGPIA